MTTLGNPLLLLSFIMHNLSMASNNKVLLLFLHGRYLAVDLDCDGLQQVM